MRRQAGIGALLLIYVGVAGVLTAVALAIAAPAAFGSHNHVGKRCGGKMSVLVWPYGHDAIRINNAPPVANPHVEVYVGWIGNYPQALFAAWVAGGKPKGLLGVGDVFIGVGCVNYGTTAKAAAIVPGGVKVSAQTALRCTFAGSGVFDLIERGKGVRVLILHTVRRSCFAPTRHRQRHQ
jgi:hypothetical protein